MRRIVLAAAMWCGAATCAQTAGLYPALISETDITGLDLSYFLGPPDDYYYGLGAQHVTFDFGAPVVINGAGPDLNVYEVDNGAVEFDAVDVLVSADGVTFFNIDSTWGAAVDLLEDDAHGNSGFRRSFDLGVSGLSAVRYVKIQGTGNGAAGGNNDFDLDAIGIVNFVPSPGTGALIGCASFVALRRRR